MAVSWKILIVMVCAGGAGTLMRFLCLRLVSLCCGNASFLPWGTLIVNVCGAFAAGMLFVFSTEKCPGLAKYLPVLMIGFLGAFTTFSTFALESV